VNRAITNPSIRHIIEICDRIFAIVSCLFVCTLVATSVLWAVDVPPVQDVRLERSIEVQKGQYLDISAPLVYQGKLRRAIYTVYLRAPDGTVAYVYPTQLVADRTKFSLAKMGVTIPRDLPSGQYEVSIRLVYWFNPFKDAIATFDLAKVQVD
jgi:hypothetical protein